MKAQRKLRKEIEAQGWVRVSLRLRIRHCVSHACALPARQANAEQRARLKQLDEDAEYVQVHAVARQAPTRLHGA